MPLDEIHNAYCGSRNSSPATGWGWKLVRPSGLCGRVFKHLGIKDSTAVTLLSLPDALKAISSDDEKQALLEMVLAHSKHLDEDLAYELEAPKSAISWANHGDAAEPSESDNKEMQRWVSTPAASPTPDKDRSQSPEPPEAGAEPLLADAELEPEQEQALREALINLQSDPEAQKRLESDQSTPVEASHLTEAAVLPEPFFSPRSAYSHAATARSFAAISTVLEATLLPRLPEIVAEGDPRWYDARARSACFRLAHWLRVPAPALHAIEQTLFEALSPRAAGNASKEELHSYHSSTTKWMMVGAAAVGGGVLTAVTAGLAAPAIAAGIGTVVGMSGGTGALSSSDAVLSCSFHAYPAAADVWQPLPQQCPEI